MTIKQWQDGKYKFKLIAHYKEMVDKNIASYDLCLECTDGTNIAEDYIFNLHFFCDKIEKECLTFCENHAMVDVVMSKL